jgi:squalene-hopene/tetraprenyl-beta-curcumene cyclase
MTWVPLLLADRSPNLRWLALCELLDAPGDEQATVDQEIAELAEMREGDPIVQELLARQDGNGSWQASEGGLASWERIRTTAHALTRLGYLGFGPEHTAVRRGAEYLFSLQNEDGSWPLPKSKAERELREAYEMIPLQTGMPLRALAAAGYANDPRAEAAYEWLLAKRLPDGAWPSGL